MNELTEYKTPLAIGEITRYGKVTECPKESRAKIEAEAEKRGLKAIFTSFTSDTFHFIDPRPTEYGKGFERIDTFFDWLRENNLIDQEIDSCGAMFGHRHRHCFQIMPENSLKIQSAYNKEIKWKGSDPKAIYSYGYTYWHFLRERPHACLTNESAARLLQEHLDYLHEINPHSNGKKTVRVEEGRFGWEDKDTKVERIVVYYGDGKRGSLDYDIAYDSATIYLDENFVRFDQVNGYDYEIEGKFNVLKLSLIHI